VHALVYGSFNPRRRKERRAGETPLTGLDWHPPQWLAVAILIVVLSCIDAFLTLRLLEQGAYEMNPVMDVLLGGSELAFTVVKIGLTAGGVVLLTLVARMRVFRGIPVSWILYLVLGGYGALVAYELWLLGETALTFY
jgi:hypothetical protein